jgi:hypothetical protein
MSQQAMRQGVLVSLFMVMFLAGVLCGALSQRYVNAQIPGMGKGVGETMKGMGGPVGSVAELGSSIVEMQEHVNGLQKNLETLKKVQSALSVGK